jgi:hypothetical protein
VCTTNVSGSCAPVNSDEEYAPRVRSGPLVSYRAKAFWGRNLYPAVVLLLVLVGGALLIAHKGPTGDRPVEADVTPRSNAAVSPEADVAATETTTPISAANGGEPAQKDELSSTSANTSPKISTDPSIISPEHEPTAQASGPKVTDPISGPSSSIVDDGQGALTAPVNNSISSPDFPPESSPADPSVENTAPAGTDRHEKKPKIQGAPPGKPWTAAPASQRAKSPSASHRQSGAKVRKRVARKPSSANQSEATPNDSPLGALY